METADAILLRLGDEHGRLLLEAARIREQEEAVLAPIFARLEAEQDEHGRLLAAALEEDRELLRVDE